MIAVRISRSRGPKCPECAMVQAAQGSTSNPFRCRRLHFGFQGGPDLILGTRVKAVNEIEDRLRESFSPKAMRFPVAE
jgi:hypothetical protein